MTDDTITTKTDDAITEDTQAALLAKAAALRCLYNYRAAFDRAEHHGATRGVLIEPPSFYEIGDRYNAVIDEIADQRIDRPADAYAAIGLAATIASDLQLSRALDEGSVPTIEKDRADLLRLIVPLSH